MIFSPFQAIGGGAIDPDVSYEENNTSNFFSMVIVLNAGRIIEEDR